MLDLDLVSTEILVSVDNSELNSSRDKTDCGSPTCGLIRHMIIGPPVKRLRQTSDDFDDFELTSDDFDELSLAQTADGRLRRI